VVVSYIDGENYRPLTIYHISRWRVYIATGWINIYNFTQPCND